MKKLISALMAGAMMFGLVACGGGSTASPSPSASAPAPSASAPVESASAGDVANDPKVTLVYAEVNPLDTIVGQTATAFKEKVEELSGGSITIDVQASGVLGSENDVLDGMLGGETTVDISRISAFALKQLRRAEVQAALHPLYLREPRAFLELCQQRLGRRVPQRAPRARSAPARHLLR